MLCRNIDARMRSDYAADGTNGHCTGTPMSSDCGSTFGHGSSLETTGGSLQFEEEKEDTRNGRLPRGLFGYRLATFNEDTSSTLR